MSYYTIFKGGLKVTPRVKKKDAKWLHDFSSVYHDDKEYPSHWCDWELTDGNTILAPNEGKNKGYYEWLVWLIHNFFWPRGYSLDGQIAWSGENFYDIGYFCAHGYSCWGKDNPWNITERVVKKAVKLRGALAFEDGSVRVSPPEDRLLSFPYSEGDAYEREIDRCCLTLNRRLLREDAEWLRRYAAFPHYRRKCDEGVYGKGGELFCEGSEDEIWEGIERLSHKELCTPAGECPDLFCCWTPTSGRKRITLVNKDEKPDWFDEMGVKYPIRWLAFLIRRFLAPRGYVLNGHFRWKGWNLEDAGTCYVVDNRIYPVLLPLDYTNEPKEAVGSSH